MLTGTFLHLVSRYSADTDLANALWLELFSHYSENGRHYHTASHLEKMLSEVTRVRSHIADWDTLLFALFYHDVVYKVPGGTNEADSAKFARERLERIGFHAAGIERCAGMILATKDHLPSGDGDTDFLLDADLSVLGAPPEDYRAYAAAIREEYALYPDFLYNPGRRKVLKQLLGMDHLFKTPSFRERYERQARLNLADELEELL